MVGTANLADTDVAQTFFEVMDEEDLWDGDMLGIEVEQKKLLLIKLGGQVHAYDDKCPHKGTTLSDGEFEDGMIICPTHRWEFCAKTGCGINPVESQLTEHPVKVMNGKILVALK